MDSLSPLLDNTDKIEGANIACTDGYEHNQSSIADESKKDGDSPIGNDQEESDLPQTKAHYVLKTFI